MLSNGLISFSPSYKNAYNENEKLEVYCGENTLEISQAGKSTSMWHKVSLSFWLIVDDVHSIGSMVCLLFSCL